MEYTSPGQTASRLRHLVVWVSLAAAILSEVTCEFHHERRHSKRYQQHPYQGYDMDPSYDSATVVPKPVFIDQPGNYTVHAGKMATLKCSVHNLGTKVVVWRRVLQEDKDNNILTVGELTWSKEEEDDGTYFAVDYRLDPRGGAISHWDLLIKNVRQRHEGMYECQITEKIPLRKYIYLTVLPPIISNPAVVLTGEEVVDLNQPLHLKCNATGGDKVPSEIDWFKDGSKLNSPVSGRVVVTKYTLSAEKALISELFIDHAETSDTGTYICRSSDKKIDSIRVTVLTDLAGTVNVKRGTGSHTGTDTDEDDPGSSAAHVIPSCIMLLAAIVYRMIVALS